MNLLNPKITHIEIDYAETHKSSWRDCLPSELSNLFYRQGAKGIERLDNYFKLGEDGIDKLIELHGRDLLQCIRIYMGCHKEDSRDQFAPLLALVEKQGHEHHYKLPYHPKVVSSNPINYNTMARVTPGMVDLFRINWNELSDMELADAFSGITVGKLNINLQGENATDELKTRRVKFYDFPILDIEQMVSTLKPLDKEQRYLHLQLGAGLTVRVTHPFNFRPIIAIPGQVTTNTIQEAANLDGTGETYFERSQPCPPYCPDGDTGELHQ